MKTKEAIEFIKWAKDVFSVWNELEKPNIEFFNQGNEVIKLLQRGKKFEQMWKELKDCNGFWHLVDKGKMYSCLVNLLEEIEQEYFPDPICGTCMHYNSDTLFCAKHPEWGEMVEQDSCDDWREDDSISE